RDAHRGQGRRLVPVAQGAVIVKMDPTSPRPERRDRFLSADRAPPGPDAPLSGGSRRVPQLELLTAEVLAENLSSRSPSGGALAETPGKQEFSANWGLDADFESGYPPVPASPERTDQRTPERFPHEAPAERAPPRAR